MWKYVGTKECNEFLLSLNLINCKNEKKYIKTIYSISNNIEKNYKIYKIKKRNGKYRTIYARKAMLVKRNPDIKSYKTNYEKWKKEAKQFMQDIKDGKKTYEEFDEWLDKN